MNRANSITVIILLASISFSCASKPNKWLSPTMMKDYDKYRTDARVTQLINALKKNNVAMGINSFTKVPSAKIIKAAKSAGVKFTLGTNNERVEELSRLAYSLQMVEECGS